MYGSPDRKIVEPREFPIQLGKITLNYLPLVNNVQEYLQDRWIPVVGNRGVDDTYFRLYKPGALPVDARWSIGLSIEPKNGVCIKIGDVSDIGVDELAKTLDACMTYTFAVKEFKEMMDGRKIKSIEVFADATISNTQQVKVAAAIEALNKRAL